MTIPRNSLAEWTIRDHGYLVNPQITAKTNREIPGQSIGNPDQLRRLQCRQSLSAAGDGSDGRLGRGPKIRVSDRLPTGLAGAPGRIPIFTVGPGAINTIHFLQTRNPGIHRPRQPASLGQYFGSKGWPFYNIPNPTNDPDAPIKIPSGANIFAQSPLKAVPSSYGNGQWQNDKYMLSSGGTKPISATIGWAGGAPDQPGSTTLHLNLAEPQKIAFLQNGYHVRGRPPESTALPNPIQDGTTVLSVDETAGMVTLSKPLLHPSESCAFTFTRPVDDYASEAMIKLSYSWAQYYLATGRTNARRSHGPDGDRRIHRDDDGDADFQPSAPRVREGNGGNRPRSGQRHDREGSPPG